MSAIELQQYHDFTRYAYIALAVCFATLVVGAWDAIRIYRRERHKWKDKE